jgi:four helix bundle protein
MGTHKSYRDWPVYQLAVETAMRIHDLTKKFPADERVGMVEPLRRASRGVCAVIAESWRKRRYRSRFLAKLSDAEGLAEETRVWLEFAARCEYMTAQTAKELDDVYLHVIDGVSGIIWDPEHWYTNRTGVETESLLQPADEPPHKTLE